MRRKGRRGGRLTTTTTTSLDVPGPLCGVIGYHVVRAAENVQSLGVKTNGVVGNVAMTKELEEAERGSRIHVGRVITFCADFLRPQKIARQKRDGRANGEETSGGHRASIRGKIKRKTVILTTSTTGFNCIF